MRLISIAKYLFKEYLIVSTCVMTFKDLVIVHTSNPVFCITISLN